VNPNLIYCSISGFGQEGPLHDLPGHDLTYAALSGLIDALYGPEPRVPGVQVVDAGVAFLAVIQILAALHARDSGPRFLDVSLLQGAQALMPGAIAEATGEPRAGRTLFDLLRGSERNNLYRCADGRWLAISPIEEPFWQKLNAALQESGDLAQGEALTDPRLHAIFARRPAEEWFSLLAAAGVPCGPVRTVHEAIADRPALPWDKAGPAPALGQHTAAWLERLGHPSESHEHR
jgi:crotonobetainyl-CoA:carnitine CoA-transferase CaiB-like acyl-CoA transferase